ncbi:hypothetical protein R3P38DRAFT_2812053 [Favolaschia claudopus]|uniref:Uncharacterized protein n=1 Tax=Favolaschia claudopus TaxID=2862362 RepID=A0AAV9Z7G9_9AGAR
MPIPSTTEADLVLTARMLEVLFASHLFFEFASFLTLEYQGAPTTLKAALIATGIDRPVTVRVPSATGTMRGAWFHPWFGFAPDNETVTLDIAVVSPGTGSSNTADLGIAIVHVNQRNEAGHPVNLALKRRLGAESRDWFGNLVILEIDMGTNEMQSLRQENADLALRCLEQFVRDVWSAEEDAPGTSAVETHSVSSE